MQARAWCDDCGRKMRCSRPDFNHVLHLLVTCFLCGAWLPVWILLAVCHNPPWRCDHCGLRVEPTRRSSAAAFWLSAGFVAFALAMLGLTILAIQFLPPPR